MFYEPKNGHGLRYNPFSALIAPRPIAWISTRSNDGSENLAPYSFFNGVSYAPPQLMFASTGTKPDRPNGKDTLSNILETEVFCVNVVSYALKDKMNMSSGQVARDIDEFDLSGVARLTCNTIDCSRVVDAPASMECKLVRVVELPGDANFVVVGEVTGIHICDDMLKDGLFDVSRFQPLARLGYQDYTRVSERFALKRPGVK